MTTQANRTSQTSMASEANPAALNELVTPVSRQSAGPYAKILLGLGLALSGAGCTQTTRPPALTEREVASFKETGETYSQAAQFGQVGAQLTFAHFASAHPIGKVNEDFARSSGRGELAANLTLLAQFGDLSIARVNESYSKSAGASCGACNLTAAAALSGKPIEQVNKEYRSGASWSDQGASILVLAAASSQKPIVSINALYKENPASGVAGATLVLGSVVSGSSLESVAHMYSKTNTLSELRGAQLAALAAIHKCPIDEVNQLWAKSAASRQAGVHLVQAALLSGKSMAEINYLYSQAPSWSDTGSALLVLSEAARARAQVDHGTGFIPIMYSERSGKTTHDYFVPVVVPGSSGYEGKVLPLGGISSAEMISK